LNITRVYLTTPCGANCRMYRALKDTAKQG
jgi:hypothetical protein